MDVVDPTPAFLLAVFLTPFVTAAVLLRHTGTGRLRRAAARRWRAQRHLWEVLLSRDGWSPGGR